MKYSIILYKITSLSNAQTSMLQAIRQKHKVDSSSLKKHMRLNNKNISTYLEGIFYL
jgi:hypothetical protein